MLGLRRGGNNPLSSDGHSKSETSTHHTLPSPSWAVGFSEAAKKKAAHVRHLTAPLKPLYWFASFGQHMLVGF